MGGSKCRISGKLRWELHNESCTSAQAGASSASGPKGHPELLPLAEYKTELDLRKALRAALIPVVNSQQGTSHKFAQQVLFPQQLPRKMYSPLVFSSGDLQGKISSCLTFQSACESVPYTVVVCCIDLSLKQINCPEL